jgi:glycosyltransferase
MESRTFEWQCGLYTEKYFTYMKQVYIFDEGAEIAAVYGIGAYIRQVCECLKGKPDIRLHVVRFCSEEKEFEEVKSDGIRTCYFPKIQFSVKSKSNKTRYYRNCWYLLRAHIQVGQADKLFFHLNYSQEYPLSALIKKTFPESSVLFTIHCQDWCFKLNGNTSYFKRLIHTDKDLINDRKEKFVLQEYESELKLFQSVDRLVCLSDYTRRLLVEEYGVPEEEISLIYNGLKGEASIFSPEDRLQLKRDLFIGEHTKVILFVGRLQDIKGIEFLIRAFRAVLQREPDAHLIIAGSGAFSTYLSEAKGYWHRITFTGRVEKADLYRLYCVADIGVMPSLHEQCSYVAIEMMMHGVPLVGSTSTGLCEMIEEGVTGLHVPVEEYPDRVEIDPELLVEKMLYLLQHPEERERMGRNARRRYESVYSAEVMGANMINFYDGFNTGA